MNNDDYLNRKYLELCKRYSLNPPLLKEIIYYESLGYNNQDIANKIGTSRQTVHNYIQKIQLMERNEFTIIILAAIVGIAGLSLIISLLSKKE